MDSFAGSTFLDNLREALHHLYDPNHLRRSPLAALFGLANRSDTSSILRNVLMEAIEGLRPLDDHPARERAWRIYESLYHSYVQRLNQQAVADQLGLSARQLRREKHDALEVLADFLCQKFNLQQNKASRADLDSRRSPLAEDLEWLQATPVENPLDLGQTLADVLELVQPLATRYDVRLENQLPDTLPQVAVHPVAFDQILITLFTLAITWAADPVVTLTAERQDWEAVIQIRGAKLQKESQPVSDEQSKQIEIAHQLVEIAKGQLKIIDGLDAFSIKLTFTCIDQCAVIVVDDNQDTLNLFQRYTYGTRYRLITTRDPEQVLALAERFTPQAIVLDVMMPDVDGWKLLGRLRQHPLTQRVPIMVCTILPQEELAFSLGASSFLKKPVSWPDFLKALDQQVATATGSR